MNKTLLWVDLSFLTSLTLVVLQKQKFLPDIGGTTIQDVGHLVAMRAAMERGVHTMSDELILQISCNIFLAFKWILMMTSGQNISHYATAKLSVHVWNHDLAWWENKIDTQKHFRETTITSFWNLNKTKIPITIVKAQMPSNPNQKSCTRDNDKMAGHQTASGHVSVNSAFTWSLLLYSAYQFCSSNVWVLQHYSVHAFDMSTIIVFVVYLGLKFKWNQLNSDNSRHTSCIHKGLHAGKGPDQRTSKRDAVSTLG